MSKRNSLAAKAARRAEREARKGDAEAIEKRATINAAAAILGNRNRRREK